MKLKENKKHLSFVHLNTQSMSSSFNESYVTLQQNTFEIITLSKTWIHDNKHLLENVKIPGHNFIYKN